MPCKVNRRWRSRHPKVTEEDYSQAKIGEDFGKGRRRWRRRVKTLAPSLTGATISGATSALFSGDFAIAGLACVIRKSAVKPYGQRRRASKAIGDQRALIGRRNPAKMNSSGCRGAVDSKGAHWIRFSDLENFATYSEEVWIWQISKDFGEEESAEEILGFGRKIRCGATVVDLGTRGLVFLFLTCLAQYSTEIKEAN
ncbi:hypothetical protein U1Q18_030625 [Sarracenia purpurea var. burkii]